MAFAAEYMRYKTAIFLRESIYRRMLRAVLHSARCLPLAAILIR